MQSIRSLTSHKDETTFELVVVVSNIDDLNKFLNDIRALPDIVEVERVIK